MRSSARVRDRQPFVLKTPPGPSRMTYRPPTLKTPGRDMGCFRSPRSGRISIATLIAPILAVLLVGGALIYRRISGTSLWDTLRAVKDTSPDATTPSKVKTALRIVALDGTVDSPGQKRAAEQVALQVPGVPGLAAHLVVNNSEASPESADDELARRVEFGCIRQGPCRSRMYRSVRRMGRSS